MSGTFEGGFDLVAVKTVNFRERFKEPMLAGVKTCTSRSYPVASVGDKFFRWGRWFTVTAVEQWKLGQVKELKWREEGCNSPEEFQQIWSEIHYIKGFVPSQLVYLHTFKLEPLK